MDQSKGEGSSQQESPETITRRIEGHIVRGAMDEERRARKALILLKARDRRIQLLEEKIAQLEKQIRCGHSRATNLRQSASFASSGSETHYLSLPPSEASDSPRYEAEIDPKDDDIAGDSTEPKRFTEMTDKVSVPRLKLPTTSVSNSEGDAVILKGVNFGFNENSSLASDEFHQDESSVDFVVTAALAFSKFDDELAEGNNRGKVFVDGQTTESLKGAEPGMNRSRTKLEPARKSASLPWMKMRRRSTRRRSKRGFERKIEKTRESNVLSKNLQEVQAGLDKLLRKSTKITKTNHQSVPEKQKVEDKVVQEDAQEAASTPDQLADYQRKIASTQTCMDFGVDFRDPTIIRSTKNCATSSRHHLLGHNNESSIIWSDEPAPQWLIEEALNRGQKFSKNDPSMKTSDCRDDEDNDTASKLNLENIVSDLEKKLCTTRAELVDALNDQRLIKSKYKNALNNLKIVVDEERNDMQEKFIGIFTSLLEKFGPNAVIDKRVKKCHKNHQKPLQHYGRLSRKLHRKLRVAALASAKLKQEVQSARKDLDEKAQQYDSLAKCFESLKLELKSSEINVNDLRKENVSLRKGIDDAREWMKTRISNVRQEKINAAQLREMQRNRELANLKKKSEEELSTIAQLRSKVLRLESANSNKGFLLGSYKSQVVDLTKEKDELLAKVKELENEKSLLRNSNAQLKASVTIISNEKEKMNVDSEKSEIAIVERMQSELATKYERSTLQKIDTMRAKYDKIVEALEAKLRVSEKSSEQYHEAVKRFLKEIDEYYREIDVDRDVSCSEASEREAHEAACTILNITPRVLTGFLKGPQSRIANSWLSDIEKITSKKNFAEDLGKLLFEKAVGR